MQKETGVTTKYVENVPEGPDAERVIREMAKRGDKVIFATSFRLYESHVKGFQAVPKNRLCARHWL